MSAAQTVLVPGDLITVGDETRVVCEVSCGRVYYSWPGKVAVRSLHLAAWAAWAAQADAGTSDDQAP